MFDKRRPHQTWDFLNEDFVGEAFLKVAMQSELNIHIRNFLRAYRSCEIKS